MLTTSQETNGTNFLSRRGGIDGGRIAAVSWKGRGPERGKQSDTEHYGYWGTRCLMVEWDGFINRSHQRSRSPLFMQIEQHAAQTITANAFGQMQMPRGRGRYDQEGDGEDGAG